MIFRCYFCHSLHVCHILRSLVKHEDDSLLISGILPESSQHSGVCRFDFLPIKLMQIMFSVAHPYLPF